MEGVDKLEDGALYAQAVGERSCAHVAIEDMSYYDANYSEAFEAVEPGDAWAGGC